VVSLIRLIQVRWILYLKQLIQNEITKYLQVNWPRYAKPAWLAFSAITATEPSLLFNPKLFYQLAECKSLLNALAAMNKVRLPFQWNKSFC
jgi:hypothetical protein